MQTFRNEPMKAPNIKAMTADIGTVVVQRALTSIRCSAVRLVVNGAARPSSSAPGWGLGHQLTGNVSKTERIAKAWRAESPLSRED